VHPVHAVGSSDGEILATLRDGLDECQRKTMRVCPPSARVDTLCGRSYDQAEMDGSPSSASREQTKISVTNPHRPFCSLTCRLVDLGVWLDEGYRIPADESGNVP
jgi:endogenous inhibitor of DNA gyrase (YacG/DUF329 family)